MSTVSGHQGSHHVLPINKRWRWQIKQHWSSGDSLIKNDIIIIINIVWACLDFRLIRLWARYFYHVIVDEGTVTISLRF